MSELFNEEPCERCGGCGRRINQKEVSRRVAALSGSRGDVAEGLGVSEVYVRSLLNGNREWTWKLLEKALRLGIGGSGD